ncbi:hypothetical protein [Neisseria sicca]|uniref:hypothetical protein n=1 Tax=Neisseria sicca TaxID=490 RepID=UPI0011BD1A76|nr:hypothetical protein [Neisseria sicca]
MRSSEKGRREQPDRTVYLKRMPAGVIRQVIISFIGFSDDPSLERGRLKTGLLYVVQPSD